MISTLAFFATIAVIGMLAVLLPRVTGAAGFGLFALLALHAISCGMLFDAVLLLTEGLAIAWAFFGMARPNSAAAPRMTQP